MTPTILDARTDFEDGLGNDELLRIQHSQVIDQVWLDGLKHEKAESTKRPAGNLHRFASIPVAVYEKWMREGFDPAKETPAKIMAKLSSESLDHFITTGKRL